MVVAALTATLLAVTTATAAVAKTVVSRTIDLPVDMAAMVMRLRLAMIARDMVEVVAATTTEVIHVMRSAGKRP